MIRLFQLLKEETFTAINKDSGKVSVFKSKDSRDSAVKAGTHSKEDKKGSKETPKSEKPNMFSKDAGYDAGDGGFGWGGETDRKPATSLPKSASELTYKHAEIFEKDMTAASGLELTTDIDDNSGVIVFTASGGDEPTYQIMIGNNDDYGKPDEFRVSLESTYGNDPAGLGGKVDKTFKSAEEAKKFAAQVAKKYSKEMKMDDRTQNESVSTRLTTMIQNENKINEASLVSFNELDSKTQSKIKFLEQLIGGKHTAIFDGIHGMIVDIKKSSMGGSYRFDASQLNQLLKTQIRWVEGDKNGVSIGF
jgi:hypothetical protein